MVSVINVLDLNIHKQRTRIDEIIRNRFLSASDKIKHEIDNLMEAIKKNKNSIKHLFSRGSDTIIKYCLLFKQNLSYKLRQNLWNPKIWGIMLVFLLIIGNSIITTHYLSSFSFEQTNDTFSYIAFIILSIFGITIINAKWIKIVAEKYARKF
jgi:hypothetical protein